MGKITWADRLRYFFDNVMSRGPVAIILWLFLLSAAMIAFVSAFVFFAGVAPESDGRQIGFVEIAWMSLLRTLDPGTMGGDRGQWPFLLSMLAVTLGGIFVVSALIGTLTSGIAQKVESLRKGRSLVAERNHTVILGWSPHIFTIVSEIVEANRNRRDGACIAILAEKDKVEMEDEIMGRVSTTANTRLVCRTGSPIDIGDLAIVNIRDSRSIVVLPAEGPDPDSGVIKTILAITNGPERRSEPYHVVAPIRDRKNLEVAKMVGRDEVELVLASDLISRITVQTCRQSGLSVVHTELLDFGGDEIYFKEEPALVGKTFGEALFAYETSSIMGLFTRERTVRLNPPSDTPIEAGDRLIAISEDDDTIVFSPHGPEEIDETAIRLGERPPPSPERALVLGWNERGPMIVAELDKYVAPGSGIVVVAGSERARKDVERVSTGLANQRAEFRVGDTTDRRTLDALSPGDFDHIIVLADSDAPGPQEADARTLVTLLHLRDIADRTGRETPIVSEMLDMRNREIAEVTRADDFIVSDRLVSLLVSQLSENKHLARVFEDLFDPEGSEIYLKPAVEYVIPCAPVSFYTVVEAARRRGEIAIGYRLKAHARDASRQYGVVVNPDKTRKVAFEEGDKIIVLAES